MKWNINEKKLRNLIKDDNGGLSSWDMINCHSYEICQYIYFFKAIEKFSSFLFNTKAYIFF